MMVTGPIPPVNQTLYPTAPPPVAPTPPAPSAPAAPVQTGFTPQAPGGQQRTAVTDTNGTDTVQLSDSAIQAQAAPPPPAGVEQPNPLNQGAPGTPPFPGVIPSAAQGGQNQTGFIPAEQQTFIQSAPTSPFQDLTAGQTLDLTA